MTFRIEFYPSVSVKSFRKNVSLLRKLRDKVLTFSKSGIVPGVFNMGGIGGNLTDFQFGYPILTFINQITYSLF